MNGLKNTVSIRSIDSIHSFQHIKHATNQFFPRTWPCMRRLHQRPPSPTFTPTSFHTLGPARPDSRCNVRLTCLSRVQRAVYIRSIVRILLSSFHSCRQHGILISCVLFLSSTLPCVIYCRKAASCSKHPVMLQGSGGWVRSVEVCG